MSEHVRVHAELAAGRWQSLSLVEQLGNVGSEVGRALRAKQQGKQDRMWAAIDRALELMDLTIAGSVAGARRRELCRVREVMCDFLVGDNAYGSTAASLDGYFMKFAVAARARR